VCRGGSRGCESLSRCLPFFKHSGFCLMHVESFTSPKPRLGISIIVFDNMSLLGVVNLKNVPDEAVATFLRLE